MPLFRIRARSEHKDVVIYEESQSFSPDTYLIQIRTTTAISGHRQAYKKR